MDTDTTTYVGLDVHKRNVIVAMLLPGRTEPVEWQEPHDATAARRLARRMLREAPGKVVCCYEAGPTGYVLQRRLRAEKVMCQVVAPSLIPVPAQRLQPCGGVRGRSHHSPPACRESVAESHHHPRGVLEVLNRTPTLHLDAVERVCFADS